MGYSKRGLFKVAHRLTKAVVRYGDCYRSTFGACIKMMHEMGLGPLNSRKLDAPKMLNSRPVFGRELSGTVVYWNEYGKFVEQKLGRFLRPYNMEVKEARFKREIELLLPSTGEVSLQEGYSPQDFNDMFAHSNIDSCMTGCKSGQALGNGQFVAVTCLVGGKVFARFVGAKDSRKFVRLYSENQGADRTRVLAAIKAAGWVQDDWAFEGLAADKVPHPNGEGFYRPYLDGDVNLDADYNVVYNMGGFVAQPRFM